MKIKLLLGILLMLQIVLLSTSSQIEGFRVLGIQAEDGTAIQIFRPQSETTEVYYPQDSDQLPYDYFFVYLDVRDSLVRNITFTLYQAETKIIQEQNPETKEWVSKNVTDYTKLVSNFTLSVKSGQNEFGDSRYVLKKIDNSIWTDLKPTDTKEKIVISYLNLKFTVYHQTDYGLVPVTQTRFEANSYVYMQLVVLVVLIIISVVIGGYLSGKVNNAYPNIPFSSLIIAGSWFVIAILLQILTQSVKGNQEEFMRKMAVIEPAYISFFFSILLCLWIPSKFRNRRLGESLLLSLNIPYEDRKKYMEKIQKDSPIDFEEILPRCKWTYLYYYYNWKNERVYTKDPDSFFGYLSNLLFGGIKIPYNKSTRIIHNNNLDEIILTLNYTESSISVIPRKYHYPIYIGLMGLTGLLCIISIVLSFVIFLAGFSAMALVTIWVYNNIQERHNIELNPLRRNSAAAIYDALVVQQIEQSLDEILLENADLKREMSLSKSIEANAARMESFLSFGSIMNQDDFQHNLPNYQEALDKVGLSVDNLGKFTRKKTKQPESTPTEDDDTNSNQEIEVEQP